jgi:hypothetical protein
MTTYTDYPFSAQGINFISRVVTDSPMGKQIANLPAGIFEQMNQQAVSELFNLKTFTLEEVEKELERVNKGGTQAFILLGENN